jgi:glycosyltransferase involved in cell wall biosynthesis
MRILITSPSLDIIENISGISSVTRFIINNNPQHQYLHFQLGKKDNKKRNLSWILDNLLVYLNWIKLMISLRKTIIHFNISLGKLSLIRDTPLILLARISGKKLILHIHGGNLMMRPHLPLWLRICLKCNLKGSFPKIVLSPLEKKVIEKMVGNRNVFILPNCIDLAEAKKFNRDYTGNKTLRLLFLSRISVEKGLEFIYQALKSLKETDLEFKFILAGTGPDEKLYLKKFHDILGGDFEFKGIVYGGRKTELLKSCDVYILPSLFEGLPMALLESMAYGLVPVTTDVGSITFVVKDRINGIILSGDKSKSIVSSIITLAENKSLMAELGRNAQNYIFINFDPVNYIAKLNEIYDY